MIDLVEHFRGRIEGWRQAFSEVHEAIDLASGTDKITLEELLKNS